MSRYIVMDQKKIKATYDLERRSNIQELERKKLDVACKHYQCLLKCQPIRDLADDNP